MSRVHQLARHHTWYLTDRLYELTGGGGTAIKSVSGDRYGIWDRDQLITAILSAEDVAAEG